MYVRFGTKINGTDANLIVRFYTTFKGIDGFYLAKSKAYPIQINATN
jgi:hypothetical protein